MIFVRIFNVSCIIESNCSSMNSVLISTISGEALGRLLKKKKKNMMVKIRKSRMSDFSCEEMKVCMDP